MRYEAAASQKPAKPIAGTLYKKTQWFLQRVERIPGKGWFFSERHACRIVGQPRGTQRHIAIVPADGYALTRAIIALAAARQAPAQQ